jgi:thiol-disulfide isomerase/thioredoxin
MKIILAGFCLLAVSFITSSIAYANPRTFSLSGKIVGEEKYTHAYLFNSQYKLADSTTIVENTYSFKGNIVPDERFGELAFVIVILGKKSLTENEIVAQRLLSNTKDGNCRVFLEENIKLIFNSDRKIFSVEGGRLNQVQSLFLKEQDLFRYRRDSAFKSIDKLDVSENEKDQQKLAEYQQVFKHRSQRFIELIRNHPDSEAALDNFSAVVVDQRLTAKEVLDAYNLFSDPLKSSKFGLHLYKDVAERIEMEAKMAAPKIKAGSKMPTFSLVNNAGKFIKTDDVYSKYTLIDFWATWCVPCRKETPNILNAYHTYADKGFKVITVSIDELQDKSLWIKAVNDDRMNNFTNLFNGGDVSGIAKTLQILSIPANYLVDANGLIMATDLRGEALTKKLSELFSK